MFIPLSNLYKASPEYDVILNEVTKIVFSKKKLGKYREIINESVKDEKKELEHLLDRLKKEQKELDKKKAVYYKGLEDGKLNMDIVADRLKQIKAEEGRITKQRLEAEAFP